MIDDKGQIKLVYHAQDQVMHAQNVRSPTILSHAGSKLVVNLSPELFV